MLVQKKLVATATMDEKEMNQLNKLLTSRRDQEIVLFVDRMINQAFNDGLREGQAIESLEKARLLKEGK